MALVVDPSAVLSIAFDDEEAAYSGAVLDEVSKAGGLVPPLFWFEIRNVLIVNERRRRLTAVQIGSFLASLSVLPIEVSSLPPESGVLALARAHDLTVYDASYLDLASRSGNPLATLDGKLRKAAEAVPVPLFAPGEQGQGSEGGRRR